MSFSGRVLLSNVCVRGDCPRTTRERKTQEQGKLSCVCACIAGEIFPWPKSSINAKDWGVALRLRLIYCVEFGVCGCVRVYDARWKTEKNR